MVYKFQSGSADFQWVERISWIPQLGISYHVGVDGLSFPLVALTALLTFLALIYSAGHIAAAPGWFNASFLMLESAMIGVFCSLDMVLFFLFWEMMLIPMYFIIGYWGGARKIYAAVKFFLYTMVGGAFMLVGLLTVYVLHHKATGAWSFGWADWVSIRDFIAPNMQIWLFASLAIGFAIKVPMYPLHTWLPDAHTEAPTAGSVLLAGVLLKMGAYGFMRFALPLFPEGAAAAAPVMMWAAILGIILGAAASYVQKDMKKLVAYSSVSHMGFVMLGIFSFTPEGISGASIQMINHGLSTGALFLVVGVIYERTHKRGVNDFGGLAKVMPLYTTVSVLVVLSSVGLPGLNGFVGEFLVIAGAMKARPAYGFASALGVILAAVYLLAMVRRVYWGETKESLHGLKDLTLREVMVFAPLLALIFAIGIYPRPFFTATGASLMRILEGVSR